MTSAAEEHVMMVIYLDRDDRSAIGPAQHVACDIKGCTNRGKTVREQDSAWGRRWAHAASATEGWTTKLVGHRELDLCPEHSTT